MSNYNFEQKGKKIRANGIELYYETFGNPQNPAVVLIMGLDCQCVLWDLAFIQPIVDAGFYVIRFDNRDIGLSTWIDDWHKTHPYTLEDMAADTIALLDALDIDKAHFIGASMGGMIAQRIAISYAERVLSLTSIMSSGFVLDTKTTRHWGKKILYKILPFLLRNFKIKNKFLTPKPTLRTYLATFRMLTGTKYTFDRPYFEALFRWCIDERKGQNPRARLHQFCAIVASGSRLHELHHIKAPTLVLHGTDDKLIPPIHAQIYASLIPNARLFWLDGVGHEIPKGILEVVHQEIFRNFDS